MNYSSVQLTIAGGIVCELSINQGFFVPPLTLIHVKSDVVFSETLDENHYQLNVPRYLAELHWRKPCSACGQEKLYGQFYRVDAKVEAAPRWSSACQDCRRKARNLKYKEAARVKCPNVFAQNKSEENAASTNKVSRTLNPAQYERTFSYIALQKQSQQSTQDYGVWEKKYGRSLTDQEKGDIVNNVRSFLTLLIEEKKRQDGITTAFKKN